MLSLKRIVHLLLLFGLFVQTFNFVRSDSHSNKNNDDDEYNNYDDYQDDDSYKNKLTPIVRKNNYGKSQQKKSPYEQKSSSPHVLSQPLVVEANAQRIENLYSPPNSGNKPYGSAPAYSLPYQQNQQRQHSSSRQQVLQNLNFAKDFNEFDPYNNQSNWMFRRFAAFNFSADHATFVVNHKDYTVDMIAIPLQKWRPQSDGPVAAAASNDVAISPKQNVLVGPNERVMMRLKFQCKTVNVADHPFPPNLVNRPLNDVRLAACAMALSDLPNTGLKFRLLATNEGVWASYTREPFTKAIQNATWRAFDVFRQIAIRKRYDDWIDGAIEYDRLAGTASWFINGLKVWSVSSLGTLPENDGWNRVALDTGAQDPEEIAVPQQMITQLAIFTSFHSVDPNNLALGVNQNLALIRLVGGPGYEDFYGPNMRFWDNVSTRDNKLYGQGCKMRLKRLIIIKADSLQAKLAVAKNNGLAYGQTNNYEQPGKNYNVHYD